MKTRELLLLHAPSTNKGKAYLNHLQVSNLITFGLELLLANHQPNAPPQFQSGKPSRWAVAFPLSAPRINGFFVRIRYEKAHQ